MFGKKMKTGSGRSRRRPFSSQDAFFTPHVFAINAVEKKSRRGSPDSQRPRRPIISSVDVTEANRSIDPTMLRHILDRADHKQIFV
jgi:hypothetical protein